MHTKPRFSQLLSDRRRSLGLSLSQAARVLRLKEQAISAFEEGRWEKIPRSGYAQAMLSSYARYLGLKPHEVIELFEQDLAEYSASVASGRIQPEVEPVTRADISSHPSFRKNKEDLYGSTGPAGSILTRSVFDATGSHPISYQSQPESKYQGADSIPSHTGSLLSSGTQRTTRTSERLSGNELGTRQETRRFSSTGTRYASSSRGRERSIAKSVEPSGYADDLYYGTAEPYQSASTPEARRSLHGSVDLKRPNVKRRSSNVQGARKQPKRSGLGGVIDAWFMDSKRASLTLFAFLAIILLLVIILAASSCTATKGQEGARIPVPASTTSTSDSEKKPDDTSSSDSEKPNDGAAATNNEDATDDTASQNTVEVTVDSGQSAWLEVINGEKSLVATTINGPWDQTYTIDNTLTIRTTKPDLVTVTRNGNKVSFDNATADFGSITLNVQKPSASDSTKKTSNTSSSSSSGTGSSGSSSSTNGTSSGTSSGSSGSSGGASSSGTSGSTSGKSVSGSANASSGGSGAAGSSTASTGIQN